MKHEEALTLALRDLKQALDRSAAALEAFARILHDDRDDIPQTQEILPPSDPFGVRANVPQLENQRLENKRRAARDRGA